MLRLSLLAAGAALALPGSPALAADQQGTAKPPQAEQKVCENIVLTGSRLATKRFCGTKEEWARRRLEDRQTVEQMQRSPCVLTHTSSTGHPAC